MLVYLADENRAVTLGVPAMNPVAAIPEMFSEASGKGISFLS